MTSYYEDGAVTIYHGDCREILPDLAYDVIVADPPYGTGWYETDKAVLTPDLLRTLAAVPLALFGYPERLCALLGHAELVPSEWVTWWPTNGACRGFNLSGLRNESEHIAILGKHRFAELRQARGVESQRIARADYRRRTPHGKTVESNGNGKTVESNGNPDSRRLGDVWTDAAPGLAFLSDQRQHPNEKPLALMHRLVDGMSEPGQIILDPFMGSGTTLRAAKDLGRRAIGIEIDERYCEVAVQRLGQEVFDLEQI